MSFAPRRPRPDAKFQKKRPKVRTKKKDPIFVDGKRPRPMYVDYKDVETLRRLMSPNGKIYGRKRLGTSAREQRDIRQAIKQARFIGLLPFAGA